MVLFDLDTTIRRIYKSGLKKVFREPLPPGISFLLDENEFLTCKTLDRYKIEYLLYAGRRNLANYLAWGMDYLPVEHVLKLPNPNNPLLLVENKKILFLKEKHEKLRQRKRHSNF